MKSLFNKYVWLQLILSILLLFGGALIVAFAIMGKQEILEDALNIIAAVILFLFGIFAILAAYVFETDKVFTNGLLYGSACIALGVFLCMRDIMLLNYLVVLLAIFFIVVGAVELAKAIILIIKKEKNIPGIVFAFIVAAIFIAGGILALIYRENVKTAFCIVAGVLLFAAGCWELFLGVKAMIVISKSRPAKKVSRKANKQESVPEAKREEPKQSEIKEIDYTETK